MSLSDLNWRDETNAYSPRLATMARGLTPFLRPFYERFALVVGMAILAAIADFFSIGLVLPLLETITGRAGATLTANTPLHHLTELLSPLSMESRIRWLLLGMLALQVIRETVTYGSTRVALRVHSQLVTALRATVLDRLLSLNLVDFQSRPLSQNYTLFNSFSQFPADLTLAGLKMVVPALTLGVYTGILFYLSPVLTLISLVSVSLVMLVSHIVIGRQQFWFNKLAGDAAALNHVALEALSAMRTVRLFCCENFMRERDARVVSDYWRTYLKSQKYGALLNPANAVLSTAVLVLVFIVGTSVLAYDGQAWVELILLYIYVMAKLASPAALINSLRSEIAGRLAGASIVADFFAKYPAVPAGKNHEPVFGDIRFAEVSFRYSESEPDVLRNVSLTFQAGKTTALVGASGAGKSTILDLLIGLYRPTAGKISSAGYDIAEFAPHGWRRNIALVSQDVFMFADTIKENIRFGKLDATNEEIMEAARRANLMQVLDDLPNGIDTWIGERGVKLSGGQVQRVAIARAFLADPILLILDEATSAQDSISERQIQDAVETLAKNRTVIVVAHRLATVKNVDHILVLEKGELVEEGTHQDLIARAGLYSQFVELQDLGVLSEEVPTLQAGR